MYLTKRFNSKASTFRKDMKYEERNKYKKNIMKPLQPVKVEKPVNITLENSWHQHLIIEDPIEIIKKKYKGGKGRRITKESLEKFKKDSRFKLLLSNAGDKMLCLPETIIESILEFSGLVSSHKDYRLIKFGLHESENKMQRLIKKWIIWRYCGRIWVK